MDTGDFFFLLAVTGGLAALGMCGCLWAMKKAGIKPMDYYEKLSFDNCTFVRDTRTTPRHRSHYRSKKGGSLSIEMACTRGTILLEFYTEEGRVLQSWRNGDPAAFTVCLPPKIKVYWRANMNHFTGSITFR